MCAGYIEYSLLADEPTEEIIPEGIVMEPLDLLADPMPRLYFQRTDPK